MNPVVQFAQGICPRCFAFSCNPECFRGLFSGELYRVLAAGMPSRSLLVGCKPGIGVAVIVEVLQAARLKDTQRLFDDLVQPLTVRSGPEGAAIAL